MGDVPGLFEEREKINASIREKITERNAERDELRLVFSRPVPATRLSAEASPKTAAANEEAVVYYDEGMPAARSVQQRVQPLKTDDLKVDASPSGALAPR